MTAHQSAEIDHPGADVRPGPIRRGRGIPARGRGLVGRGRDIARWCRHRTGWRRDGLVAGCPQPGMQPVDLIRVKDRRCREVRLLAGEDSQVRHPTRGDRIEGQALAPVVGVVQPTVAQAGARLQRPKPSLDDPRWRYPSPTVAANTAGASPSAGRAVVSHPQGNGSPSSGGSTSVAETATQGPSATEPSAGGGTRSTASTRMARWTVRSVRALVPFRILDLYFDFRFCLLRAGRSDDAISIPPRWRG